MSLPFRLLAFGVLALAAVGLSGCTSSSAHPNTSTVAGPTGPTTALPTTASTGGSASPSPTPSPTRVYPADVPLTGHNVNRGEKPPVYPAAAKARTQAGANAFAEFYLHTFDWAYATTNSAYVRHYSAASCGLCDGLATGITATAASSHWYLGGRFTVHPASSTPIGPVTAKADYCATSSVDTTAASVVDKTGAVINGDGAHRGVRFKACMTYTGSAWQITYLARL